MFFFSFSFSKVRDMAGAGAPCSLSTQGFLTVACCSTNTLFTSVHPRFSTTLQTRMLIYGATHACIRRMPKKTTADGKPHLRAPAWLDIDVPSLRPIPSQPSMTHSYPLISISHTSILALQPTSDILLLYGAL